jgi:hypothetical protein
MSSDFDESDCVIPKGPHAGKKFWEVPTDYLERLAAWSRTSNVHELLEAEVMLRRTGLADCDDEAIKQAVNAALERVETLKKLLEP